MRPTAVIRNAKALVEANAAHNIYTSGITAINLPATTSACQVKTNYFDLILLGFEEKLYIIICYLKIEVFYNMFRIFIHLL